MHQNEVYHAQGAVEDKPMGFFDWFRKRYELPVSPTSPGELKETLTKEAVRGQVEIVKQAGKAHELRSTISQALTKMADHTLEEIRRG